MPQNASWLECADEMIENRSWYCKHDPPQDAQAQLIKMSPEMRSMCLLLDIAISLRVLRRQRLYVNTKCRKRKYKTPRRLKGQGIRLHRRK